MKNFAVLLITFFSIINLHAQLVITVAGQPEISGNEDGAAFDATFNNPHGIAVGTDGIIYTADRWSHTIRRITLDGVVTTLAGLADVSGDADGEGTQALFNEPWGLCVDPTGNIIVADTRNNKIRKITPDGQVTTIAGSGSFGTSNGFGNSATFGNPTGIECDSIGNIYVADHLTHIIRKIDTLGVVSTIAGIPYQMGDSDGQGELASFRRPYGLTLDLNGDILVADEWNHKIRRVTPDGWVTTVAGDGEIDNDNGLSTTASFNYPWDVTVDSFGNIFVADGYNYTIRKITPNGQVSSYAGTTGINGAVDGEGNEAKFSGATALAFSPVTKEIYVGDAYNNLVRTIINLQLGVTLSIISGSPIICAGEYISLNASPDIFNNYHFYLDGQIIQSGMNSVLELNNISGGTHTLQVSAQDNSSSFSSNEITIQVIEAETPTITAESSTSFFEGDSVILSASYGMEYLWSNGEILPTTTIYESGTYTVDVTDENGCIETSAPIEVIVQNDPEPVYITINGSSEVCPGESTLLSSSYTSNNQWLKNGLPLAGATTTDYEVFSSGVYQVQTTQNGWNSISEPVEISVQNDWNFEIYADKNTGTIQDVFEFEIESLSTLSKIIWDFGDGNSSTHFSPSHQFQNKGWYSISATAKNSTGCEKTITKTNFIEVENENHEAGISTNDLFIPTAFTPNGDGENDILLVRGGNIAQMNFIIFNQWGEEVFISSSKDIGWDGTMNGNDAQSGNYVYLFEYVTDEGIRHKLSGRITLLR